MDSQGILYLSRHNKKPLSDKIYYKGFNKDTSTKS